MYYSKTIKFVTSAKYPGYSDQRDFTFAQEASITNTQLLWHVYSVNKTVLHDDV
jgi:hypothetical protein